MAYSMKKKIRVRIGRFADQLLQLRQVCANAAESGQLDQLLREVSALADRADAIFTDNAPSAPAFTAQRSQPVIIAPAVAQTIQRQGRLAEHVAAQTGMAARMSEDEGFDTLPCDMTIEEQLQAMLDGRMGGVYDGEAAKKLYADEVLWNLLSPQERMGKIRQIADHLAATDDRADDWPTPDNGTPPPAAAPAVDPDGGVVF